MRYQGLVTAPERMVTRLLALLNCAAFLAVLGAARSEDMQAKLPPDSYARAMMSIGISLSKLSFGAEGYELYIPVIDGLARNGFDHQGILSRDGVNRAISRVKVMDIELSGCPQEREARGKPCVQRDWGDDKGYSDFTTLAFRLFGTRLESLFWMYFLLLGVAAGTFLIRFRNDSVAQFVLLVSLVALSRVIETLPNSSVTAVVHDSRFLPTISAISALHICLAALRNPGNIAIELPLQFTQVAILIFVVNSRSSAVWQVLFLFAVLIAVIVLSRWQPKLARRRRQFASFVALAAVSAGMLALSAYKDVAYSDIYRTDGTRSHVFWHNIYMGLGVHPEAVQRFGLLPDDATVYKHAQAYVTNRPDLARAYRIASADGCYPLFNCIGWRSYDGIVRSMYFEFLERNVGYGFESYFLYKPLYLGAQVLWQLGILSTFPGNIEINPVHAPSRNLRSPVLHWPTLAVLALAATGIFLQRPSGSASDAWLTALLLMIFSTIPAFVVAPLYYDLHAHFMLVLIVVYLGAFSVLSLSFSRWREVA